MMMVRRLTLLLAALAVLAVGCTNPESAATVNDDTIAASLVYPLAGIDAERDRVSADEFRGSLTLLIIQSALLQAAADDYGLNSLSDQATLDAYLQNAPQAEFQAIQGAVNAGVEEGRDAEAAASYIVTQQVISTTVKDAILHDDLFLASVYAETPEFLVSVCASHILVATAEEAQLVLDRIASGEDFATVATEVSLDTQSPGGALPCPSSPYLLGPAFGAAVAGAPVGEVSGPIETQFGYHVVLVDSREEPSSYEELQADPGLYMPPQLVDSEYGIWLDDALDRALITVRSQIGTWIPAADGISAPPASP